MKFIEEYGATSVYASMPSSSKSLSSWRQRIISTRGSCHPSICPCIHLSVCLSICLSNFPFRTTVLTLSATNIIDEDIWLMIPNNPNDLRAVERNGGPPSDLLFSLIFCFLFFFSFFRLSLFFSFLSGGPFWLPYNVWWCPLLSTALFDIGFQQQRSPISSFSPSAISLSLSLWDNVTFYDMK